MFQNFAKKTKEISARYSSLLARGQEQARVPIVLTNANRNLLQGAPTEFWKKCGMPGRGSFQRNGTQRQEKALCSNSYSPQNPKIAPPEEPLSLSVCGSWFMVWQ
jgi:hypothetical protein